MPRPMAMKNIKNMKISNEVLLIIGLIIVLVLINQNPLLSAVISFFIIYMITFATTRDFTKSLLTALLIMLVGLLWNRNSNAEGMSVEGMENQDTDETSEPTEPTESTETSEPINNIEDAIGNIEASNALTDDDSEYFTDEVTKEEMGVNPEDLMTPDMTLEDKKKRKSELLDDDPIDAMSPSQVQRELYRHIDVSKQLKQAIENLAPVLQQGTGVLKAFEDLKMKGGKGKGGGDSFADNLRQLDKLIGQ